ncbi:alpha-galactosidase [Streptacidiphilus anmyonensis]|uniref:alpha-galactosidase n=1 Tax=Streptacidiphilus anmyonensis TaxID=405782 RepID=UPI000AFDCA04|nr:RICIN domain-containing protein [Streptacidiphilus anmyonensis]
MRAPLPRTARAVLALALAAPALAFSLGATGLATAVPAVALDNGTALTPPMGWNSWNSFGPAINEQEVKQTIDYMSANGLATAGYNTVTIDDGWSLLHRSGQTTDIVKDAYGSLQLYDAGGNPVSGTDGTGIDPTSGHLIPDPDNFPSQTVDGQTVNGIQYLAWYAHSKGMKFGLYATDTYTTCQGHPGSLGHEAVDASDFVSWGVDFVKYDDCPYGPPITGPDGHDYGTQGEGKELTQSIYARVQTFQKALDAASAAQGRPKVALSVSAQPVHTGLPYLQDPNDPARTDPVVAAGTQPYQAPGYAPTGVWCGQVANLCRIGGDRDSELDGVLYQGQLQTALQYRGNVRPGSWNDMDMMFAGWQDPYGLWGTTDTCSCHKPFTDTESQTEISILSMMAAPLISGADFRTAADSQHSYDGYTWSTGISSSALALYENRDVIAVDQDSLAKPATLVGDPPNSSTAPVVLQRQLAGGDTAVLLVNQDPSNTQTVTTSLAALGLPSPGYSAKNLWTGATGEFTTASGSGGGTISASVPPHGAVLYRLSPLPTTVPATVVDDGRYHSLSTGAGTGGLVLEASGTCSAPVTSVADLNTWWPSHTSEQWTFTSNPDGTVRISDDCDTSTQVHTVLAAGTSAGDSAYLLNYSAGNPWQEWRVVQNTATGALTVTNVATGLALDTAGTAAGSTVVTNSPNPSAPGQSWSLVS